MKPPLPPKPTRARDFKPPVKWLLGPQLLASLRSMVMYAVAGSKLDARDWMSVKPLPPFEEDPKGEFWFDYLADSGDGQMATYSVAYLCLSDIEAAAPRRGAKLRLVQPGGNDKPSPEKVSLPRGQFLFVGGDTAYHVADHGTLAERFQDPFRWAAADHGINDNSERRHIFGIPGNHDYYDAIDGFNRQFRDPLAGDGVPLPSNAADLPQTPQLQLPGFKREQTASYLALKLPFKWWLWGVDCEIKKVDLRQRYFFRQLGKPNRLIVATPEPTTVRGRPATPEDKTNRAFEALRLARPFFLGEKLTEDQCRVDLSGDTHHYARYWGPPEPTEPAAPSESNYASVVSGLGGAFLHPSHVQSSELGAQILYPSPPRSRGAFAARLFNPFFVANGGFVWLFGAIVAVIMFAASRAPNSRPVLEPLLGLDTSQAAPGASSRPLDLDTVIWPLVASVVLGIILKWDSDQKLKPRTLRVPKTRVFVAGVASLLSLAVVGVGLFAISSDRPPSLTNAMVLVSHLVWSVLATSVALRIRDALRDLARAVSLSRWDYAPVVLSIAVATLEPVRALALVGSHESATTLLWDSIAVATIVGLGLGFVALGIAVGAAEHGAAGKTGFGLLGALHACMQLGLPLVMVRLGNVASIATVLVLTGIFALVGWAAASRGARWSLLLLWMAYGVAVVTASLGLPPPADWSSGWKTYLVVALVGAFMSCVSLGWYLAVSLAFGGHHNEAGGAARIGQFKQFIRFRLTEKGLTGFVIAIDEPKMNGAELIPMLVDVFTLQPNNPNAAELAP